jgi:iron(III) transport system ATP-binding protein
VTIQLSNITQRFGTTPVLNGVSLEIGAGEFFFLLGPSGCGKTTLLRIIAGFQAPDAGELRMGGNRVNDLPPHQRHVGMVFQNYALWPHLSVFENVAYGLEVRKVPAPERRRRVDEVLDLVRLGGLGARMPGELSGGQQQRVALARALVIRPDVLLLDEPLSNLDARLRLELRDEIRRIQEATRVSTVYVTHDQREALALADRVAVMEGGRVAQIGSPRDIYTRPRSRFVAEFLGEVNWIEGTVVAARDGLLQVETPVGRLTVPVGVYNGEPSVRVGFRPESVLWGPVPNGGWQASVVRSFYLGEAEEYRLELPGGARLRAVVSNPREVLPAGAAVEVSVRPEDLFVVPR